jgi:hypothetical protein
MPSAERRSLERRSLELRGAGRSTETDGNEPEREPAGLGPAPDEIPTDGGAANEPEENEPDAAGAVETGPEDRDVPALSSECV